jgi:hypothetical protein
MGNSYKDSPEARVKVATPEHESSPIQKIFPMNEESNHHLIYVEESLDVNQTLKQRYVSGIIRNSRLSLGKLNEHIYKHHPQKFDGQRYKDYSLCGSMPNLATCCQKRRVPRVSQNIGLGPSLFLISLKAYIKLIFVITLFSIPTQLILSG